VARSIWSHTARSHNLQMLDGFVKLRQPGVHFSRVVSARGGRGLLGEDWVSRPLIRHSFEWVEKECHARGLVVRELPDVINGQTWLCIQTPAAAERDAVMMPAGPNRNSDL